MDSFGASTFALEGDFGDNQIAAAGSLIDKVKSWLSSIVGPMPSKEEVLKVVGEAYDAYVAPIDLPGVPNLIEPRIDAMLRVVVLVAVGKIYDQLAGA
jgi:hypothetical protein